MKQTRQTRQKEIISSNLNQFSTFFTAEELATKVQIKYPQIGIATIYRFLKDCATSGSLHAFTCGKKTVYSRNLKNHSHFICEKCGNIEHINVEKIDFLKERNLGEICHVQINVTGVCKKCSK
ncbi:transcriptional repressor [Candidatus Woesearchaeota archaeon]|nr:transcriptional repressor [Candidatus Woesearchaeota archaeon]